MIPKPGGGERPLGIPTIRDRVVQTAAMLILQPIFEPELEPHAYASRPGRGALDAVREVHQALCAGRHQVVDADLSKDTRAEVRLYFGIFSVHIGARRRRAGSRRSGPDRHLRANGT
mgnify:CR=1 FL=1